MKLKVCGMKYNIDEVADLQPDYLGFIFYDKSPRNFDRTIPQLPKEIKKVGVFVDAELKNVLQTIKAYGLDAVQLHGHETPDYCRQLRKLCHSEQSEESSNTSNDAYHSGQSQTTKPTIEIIKVFSIKDEFNFEVLKPFEDDVDYFLFDTKGKLPGGNGYAFDWSVLEQYPSSKPYFLSGGISLDEIDNIETFVLKQESKFCYAIDVNSKFEIEPGLKDINKLKKFKKQMISSAI